MHRVTQAHDCRRSPRQRRDPRASAAIWSRACSAHKRTRRYDRQRYKPRSAIERFFGSIKRFGRAAARYEKKTGNDLGFTRLASLFVRLE
jgi:transposase